MILESIFVVETSAQQQLLASFRSIPDINSPAAGEEVEFQFPKITIKRRPDKHLLQPTDVSVAQVYRDEKSSLPKANLVNAIRKAVKKPEFGKTAMEAWRDALIYQSDRISRNGKARRLRRRTIPSTRWKESEPINQTEESAQAWFELFLDRVAAGGIYKHSQALTGGPGCGKSTLVKYLITKNYLENQRRHIVFSRFEFLKFWELREQEGVSLEGSLESYLSFINARDLILNHFFVLDGNRFERKFQFQREAAFRDETDRILKLINDKAAVLERTLNASSQFLLEELLACLYSVDPSHLNKELMEHLKHIPTRLRILIVFALSEGKTIVTVFDGMDSLKLEDALVGTPEWKAVRQIVVNRRAVCNYEELRKAGIRLELDSLVIMRDNTVALLELDAKEELSKSGFSIYSRVGALDGLTAMTVVIQNSVRFVEDFKDAPQENRDEYVFNIMTVIQRTWLAICRGNGVRVRRSLIYNFFDGNLRSLFSFITTIIEWSFGEMLRNRLLKTDDYFLSVGRLAERLASEDGNVLLRRKSYRVVELLLFSETTWFENAVSREKINSDFYSGYAGKLSANADYSGQIDNIFNYLDADPKNNIDDHSLLEKIRIVQLAGQAPIAERLLKKRLETMFGYHCGDLTGVLALLLKTDFLTAEMVKDAANHQLVFKATAKGVLCVNSVMRSMGYVEHIFHKTLFPRQLLDFVDDRPRSEDLSRWITASIRNAFIFLTYLKHVENNPARRTTVPKEFRIYEPMLENLSASVLRMTTGAGFREQIGPEERSDYLPTNELIASRAKSVIDRLVAEWRQKGIVKLGVTRP